jgi:hypothetical protein
MERAAAELQLLPGAFDYKGFEGCAFALGEGVFVDLVDAAAARSMAEFGAEMAEGFFVAGDHDLDVTVFGVANPAAEGEFAGFAMDEPAEADTLDASFNEEVEDHRRQVWQMAGR